jgi:hypothetical protein
MYDFCAQPLEGEGIQQHGGSYRNAARAQK